METQFFLKRLQLNEIIPITDEEWVQLQDLFELWQCIDTGMAGELLLLRGPTGVVAVEQPEAGKRVVRPLSGEDVAQQFVKQRLDAYERMWDG